MCRSAHCAERPASVILPDMLFRSLFRRALRLAWLMPLASASAASVTFTFSDNPAMAAYRNAGAPVVSLPSGFFTGDLDPGNTGLQVSFGSGAPAGTFGIGGPYPAGYLALFPNPRFQGHSLTEINATDATDHPLQLTTTLGVTAIEFDWISFAGVMSGNYVVVSDGVTSQTYFDDGSMTLAFDDGFEVTYNGSAAGHVRFETTAPATSITITAYDTTITPGTPVVQVLAIDSLVFTVVPEPATAVLTLLPACAWVLRRRRTAC